MENNIVSWLALIAAFFSIGLTMFYRYGDKKDNKKDKINKDLQFIINSLTPIDGGNYRQAILNASQRIYNELGNSKLHKELNKQLTLCNEYAEGENDIDLATLKSDLRDLAKKMNR